jgi:hypothetical protein
MLGSSSATIKAVHDSPGNGMRHRQESRKRAPQTTRAASTMSVSAARAESKARCEPPLDLVLAASFDQPITITA